MLGLQTTAIVIPLPHMTNKFVNKPEQIAFVVKESAVEAHQVQVHQRLEPKVIVQITACCTRQVHKQ